MNHSEIVSFLWGVADLVRDTFKRGKYQDVILPLTVLRRLDGVLAPTKEKVLRRQAELRGRGLQDLDAQLRAASGFAFYNTSRYDFEKLLADAPHLAANLRNYIAGFSPNMREVLEKFDFDNTISKLDEAGLLFHSQQLTRLVAGGILERIGRGQYRLAGQPITEHHALIVAARVAPHGVICLLSALGFHGIGTQLPADVWVAIERGRRAPATSQFPLRIVRFSGAAFAEGIETHRVDGQTLRVYSVAKTLADLFKHRNAVGLGVALEALREAWRERKFTMAALDRAARVCRVERVMRPYVEAIVS